MARSVKKGVAVKIGGAVTFPVDVFPTVSADKEVSFNNCCNGTDATTGDPVNNSAGPVAAHAPSKVQQKLVCPICQNEDRASFHKGKEITKGTLVLIPQADIDAAAAPQDVRETLSFTAVPRRDVLANSIPTGTTYQLGPSTSASDEGYGILAGMVRGMAQDDSDDALCLLAQFAVRTAPATYLAAEIEGVLRIVQLADPEQVVESPKVPVPMDYDADLTEFLLGPITQPAYDAATFVDTRKETLRQAIANGQAVAAGAAPTPIAAAAAKPAMSTLDALRAQMAATKGKPAKATKAPAKKSA